jgi:hypothetical protein
VEWEELDEEPDAYGVRADVGNDDRKSDEELLVAETNNDGDAKGETDAGGADSLRLL